MISYLIYLPIFVICCLCLFGEFGRWGRVGFLTPISATCIGIGIFFLVPASVRADHYPYTDVELTSNVVMIIGVGTVAFVCGYLVTTLYRNRSVTPLSPSIVYTRLLIVILLVYAICVMLLLVISNGIHSTLVESFVQSGYRISRLRASEGTKLWFHSWELLRYLQLPLIPLAVLGLTTGTTADSRGLSRLILWFVISTVALFQIFQGVRLYLFTSAGTSLTFLLLRMQKKSLVSRAGALIGILLSVLVVGILFQLYVRPTGGFLESEPASFSLSSSVHDTFGTPLADQNVGLAAIVASDRMGEIDRLWGESYLLTLTAYIPRSWWSAKPSGRNLMPMSEPLGFSAPTNSSVSIFGEMIVNFSIASVVPIMALYGVVAGGLWKIYLKNRHSAAVQLFYSWSVPTMIMMVRGNFNAVAGTYIYSSFVLLLALYLSRGNLRGGERVPVVPPGIG